MYRIEFTGETFEELKEKVKELTMLFYPMPSNSVEVTIKDVKTPKETAEKVKPVDRDEVKKRIAEIVKAKGNTKLKAILDEFGAAKVKDISDDKLPELLERMEAA